MHAHNALAVVHYLRGESSEALRHCDRVNEIYDPVAHRTLVSVSGVNSGVVSRAWSAWALWVRGHPDRSLDASTEAIALASEAKHAFSLAYALAWASVGRVMRRERKPAVELTEETIAIAEKRGFPIPLGVARLIQIWSATSSRQTDEATDQVLSRLQEALAQLGATGTQAAVPQILGGVADICLEVGRPGEAAGYVEAALATSARTNQHYWDADLYRVKADVLQLGGGGEKEAEKLLRKALEIAVSQEAKSLHLRAATSLARLLANRGQKDDARTLLAPVYDWFTEGFDTQDLKAAKELLAELA